VPCRRARTDAGGAIGREALDAGTVASGASIKAGEPGEPGYAFPREPLDARTDAGGAIGRKTLDASTVASGASIKPASPARRSTVILAGRADPPCPVASYVDLLGYRQSIIDLDAEVTNRALDFVVAQRSCAIIRILLSH
jgi:hypothetical protein